MDLIRQEELKQFFADVFKGPEYQKRLSSLSLDNDTSITFRFEDLGNRVDIARDIIEDAADTLTIIQNAAYEELANLDSGYARTIQTVNVKVVGLDEFISMRDLASQYIGKLVMIRGIVNRVSPIRPMYIGAQFRCRDCGEYPPPEVQEHPYVLSRPSKCVCKGNKFDLIPEMSKFVDSQEIRVQELPEDTPSGQTPRYIDVIIFTRDLINLVKCGDIVDIVGIDKVTEIYRFRTMTRFTKPFLVANNIILKSKEPEAIEISDEEKEKILELSKDPNLRERLVASFAPTIYGNEWIKEACLYLLFGGVPRSYSDVLIRGDIHVLLIGDPATAKSQILKTVSKIAPRGMYASGKGASAAGLTAAVVKDDMGEFTLEGGVMVLSDKGVACIDEIDKMRNEDRVAIHEAMEQQTVSINKAGINVTLNSRTAVLAAGNPTLGRYDIYKTPADNISNIPQTLFSRFDLIFILLDKPQEDVDQRMSEHMLEMFREEAQVVPPELIKKYVAYSKRVSPVISAVAKQHLKDYYVSVRKKSNGSVAITPRQLEALIRITQAHARMFLKNDADENDAEMAIKIFGKSLEQVGIDPTTGHLDADIIETNKPKVMRDKCQLIISLLPMGHDEIILELEKKGISPFEGEKLILQLMQEGVIFEPIKGHYKKT